jgi:hypothetical protein
MRALLLDVGCWHDFCGQMKPLSEVVKSFWREGVVVPLPGELGFEVAARGQGLAGFDDLNNNTISTFGIPSRDMPSYVEVLGIELAVFGEIVVFLGHEHSLTEEILVDFLAIGFGDEPGTLSVYAILESSVITYIVASSWRYSGNRVQCGELRLTMEIVDLLCCVVLSTYSVCAIST